MLKQYLEYKNLAPVYIQLNVHSRFENLNNPSFLQSGLLRITKSKLRS